MRKSLCYDRIIPLDRHVRKYPKSGLLTIFLVWLVLSSSVSAGEDAKNSLLPPVARCKNITVQVDVGGMATITAADINDGSYDPDGVLTNLMVSPATFNCSRTGPNTVILTVTDDEGLSSSCQSTVTVEDRVPPVINTKPFELVLGDGGTASLLPENLDNGTSDNCGPVTLTISKTTFSCSDLGDNDVTLTAVDSHGNSSSLITTVRVSSTLDIAAMAVSSCDLAPTLALFKADIGGGNGDYDYLWRGLDVNSRPFMVIIPFPPSLQFYNTSTLQNPFFNSTMPDGLYDIQLVVTDGNGCTDTSVIRLNKAGIIFNNVTMRYSEACEGEIVTYTVNNLADATYSWTVVNGTILTTDLNNNTVEVRWNTGVQAGVVTSTLHEANNLFPGGQCESSVIDSVALSPVPVPLFNNPAVNVCSGSVVTYSLTSEFNYYFWTVAGGTITGGGQVTDNSVTVLWGNGPAGNISVSAGLDSDCTGSAYISTVIFNLSGSITTQSDITCNGNSDGSVTALADPGSGQPPYSYSVDNGAWQSSGSFTGLGLGNHIVTIRDNLLCTSEIPFIINQPEAVEGTISGQINVSCFGGADGSLSVSASGGTPPFQYAINGGNYQDGSTFGGLSAGSYTVSIRDSHNCVAGITAVIDQPASALTGVATVTDVDCFGNLTGRVDVTVTGGTSPYTFIWNNGSTSEDLLNIGAGSYTVTITDDNGCPFILTAVVVQPSSGLSLITATVNVLCFGSSTGSVDLTVAGGIPPYSYNWSNGATTEDIINLTTGVYTVTVNDSKGCNAVTSGTVTGPSSALGGTITSQENVLCFGINEGSVTVAGTGGTTPYEYSLGAGAYQSSGTFSMLGTGGYVLTIRDANQCIFIVNVNITGPVSELGGSIMSQTDVLCFGDSSGSVSVNGTGGTSPYQYSIDGGSFQESGAFNNLNAGSHTVIIRDTNQCTFSLPVTVLQPLSPLNGNIMSLDNVMCYGDASGNVTVAGSGGTIPYSYSIDGETFLTTGDFENLMAGNYIVIVRDQNLCQYPVPVSVTQPAGELVVTTDANNVLCFGGSTGSAAAIVTGGTPAYTFSWNTVPFQNSQSATGLQAGSYTVTVTDQNGCVTSADAVISQPPGVLTATISVTDVACSGGVTGALNLTVTNATLPVTYLWSNGATTEDLSNLPAGTYSVSITDANGCSATAEGTVDYPPQLEATMEITNIPCFGEQTGVCDITATGGTTPYSYLWSNGAETEDISGIGAGIYQVTVTDARGCTFVSEGSVTQPSSAITGTIISQTDVTVYGGNDGALTIAGAGGIPPYEYSLNGGNYQSSGIFSSLIAGSYTITIRDANHCTHNITVTITQPVIPLALDITGYSDVACKGDATGSITVSAWGGYTPYEYRIDGGAFQSSGLFGSLPAGTHVVAVRDASLAQFEITVTIAEPEALNITLSGEDALCNGQASGTALAIVTGGVEPYHYSWSTTPEQTTASLSGLPSGDYSVTVTDENGCRMTEFIRIGEPSELQLSSSSEIASCPDSDDGSINLSVSGGVGPYNIYWSDGATVEDRSGLVPGEYSVVVTDQNLCAGSLDIDVEYEGSFNCLLIPGVITPNNDGFNDTWRIRNIEIYPDAEVRVFNRWGKLVFKTRNLLDEPWDGKFNGKLVPTDSYHYILYLNDGRGPRSGVISVIR